MKICLIIFVLNLRNILLKNGTIKIGDLGSAKFISNSTEMTKQIISNFRYMSPELLNQDDHVSKKTDIWYVYILSTKIFLIFHKFIQSYYT